MAVRIESSEHDQGRELMPTTLDVVESLQRGEIDMQIRTARAFPRSLEGFMHAAKSMACLNEQVAATCLYAVPRGGKVQEGPSARLAEICASAWGNCRAAARIIAIDDHFIIANGAFYDLERNVAIIFEVRRRITDHHGTRFSDDMIAVTGNAACSIALRNAVFKGIPKAFWGPIYDAARETAKGKHVPLELRRQNMLAYYAELGVSVERILAAVERPSVQDLGEGDILTLRGAAEAIKDGELTLDAAFPPITAAVTGTRADHLAQTLAKKGQPAARPVTDLLPDVPSAAPRADEPTKDVTYDTGAGQPTQTVDPDDGGGRDAGDAVRGPARRTRRNHGSEGGLPGLG